MAERTPLTQEIDHTLDWLFAGIADIRELASEWADLHEAERVSEELEWLNDMAGDLPFLHAQYVGATMNQAQRERYRALLWSLRALIPTLHQLELELPHVPIDEVLSEQAAARM